MQIQRLSIRALTVLIFSLLGMVAIILSILAGNYFRQAALNAQMNSLSRVIEVAAQETVRDLTRHTFDLGMKLAHNRELLTALQNNQQNKLVSLLDDSFISGFSGFSKIDLQKIRIYDIKLNFIAQSAEGIHGLTPTLASHLVKQTSHRQGIERLKAIDALWLSAAGPMHSTLVPIGGLHLAGYLEIVVDPAFNLPNISHITRTPISIYSASGEPLLLAADTHHDAGFLPIAYTLNTSDQAAAFQIVGYEDVSRLNRQMNQTQLVTISGFLLLSLSALAVALWMFSRFLFKPLRRMIADMQQMRHGRLDLTIDQHGLREFYLLADSFNAMASQIRRRTEDLEHMLDLDDSAIICFRNDSEAAYFNRSAIKLFGYNEQQLGQLELADLFTEDIQQLVQHNQTAGKLQCQLHCITSQAEQLPCDAVISQMDVDNETAYALIIKPQSPTSDTPDKLAQNLVSSLEQNGQRMEVIEQSLHSLLEITRHNPQLLNLLSNVQDNNHQQASESSKQQLREQVVITMQATLACWEHELHRSKLQLAEESRIWPVYIDKSTPTTRTLDKYLQIDTCPNNPRSQRVIDSAEFVLRQLDNQQGHYPQTLQTALQNLRNTLAGMQ